ncbi:hypothetical protein CH372_20480 [Leptospira meyeri]|nr:hypothetical protein CH372_20480 [Leptospira meyeri]
MKAAYLPQIILLILKIINFTIIFLILSSCIKDSHEIIKNSGAINENPEWKYGWGHFNEKGNINIPNNCSIINKCNFLFLPLKGKIEFPPTLSDPDCKKNKDIALKNIHFALWNMIVYTDSCSIAGDCFSDNLDIVRIKSLITKINKYEVIECKQSNSIQTKPFCDCLIYYYFPLGKNQLDQLINLSIWPKK